MCDPEATRLIERDGFVPLRRRLDHDGDSAPFLGYRHKCFNDLAADTPPTVLGRNGHAKDFGRRGTARNDGPGTNDAGGARWPHDQRSSVTIRRRDVNEIGIQIHVQVPPMLTEATED